MKSIIKYIAIMLACFYITSTVFCLDTDQIQIKKIGGIDTVLYNIMTLHYTPEEDAYYILGLGGDSARDQNGMRIPHPKYESLDRPPYFRKGLHFTKNGAIAIEALYDPNTYSNEYFLNDFRNPLQKIPYDSISQVRMHNGLIGFYMFSDINEFIFGSKEEIIAGKANRYVLPNAMIWGLDFNPDENLSVLIIQTPDNHYTMNLFSLYDGTAIRTIPLRENTAHFLGLKINKDQITVFNKNAESGNWIDQYDFEGNLLTSYSLGENQPISVYTQDDRILFWKETFDENGEWAGYDFMEVIPKEKPSSGYSIMHPLIQEYNHAKITEAHYIDGGFGLFHPSANDPENENARDRSIILAPLRSTQAKATLDIPYCDIQKAFSSEATTLLIQWNESNLAIPIDSLNCNEILDQASCNTKATLRLHLSISEGQIQLDQKELLATESLDDCHSLIHHTLLP